MAKEMFDYAKKNDKSFEQLRQHFMEHRLVPGASEKRHSCSCEDGNEYTYGDFIKHVIEAMG